MKSKAKIKIIDGLMFCYGVFNVDDGIDYADMGINMDDIPTEIIETRIFIEQIESYNESSDESIIIRLKSTDSFEIECAINEFDKIILNYLKTKNNGKEI